MAPKVAWQEYDYKVIHRPGNKSANCDGLTRQPLAPDSAFDVDPFEQLPTDQKIVRVLTREQRKRKADSIEDERDEKCEELQAPLQAASLPSILPAPLSPEPVDKELFVNYFFRRSFNSRPFFACAEEREGWDTNLDSGATN